MSGLRGSAEKQIASLEQWNSEHSLGFSRQEIAKAQEITFRLTESSRNPYLIAVLYFCLGTPLETLWAYLDIINPLQSRDFRVECGALRVLPGIQFVRGLFWEVIDLCAYRITRCTLGTSPIITLRNPTSPHFSVLAAAAHSDQGILSTGRRFPSVFIPGLQVRDRESRLWSWVLYLFLQHRCVVDYQILLSVDPRERFCIGVVPDGTQWESYAISKVVAQQAVV